LPVLVAGDSTYRPLSRGLAELITTDLAYIRTLKLLERLQIGVLLDELKLGTSERADPATAARVGRLLRAERMVQGSVTIPCGGSLRRSSARGSRLPGGLAGPPGGANGTRARAGRRRPRRLARGGGRARARRRDRPPGDGRGPVLRHARCRADPG